MSVNYNPATVTDGLVLCIDPSNPRSYPGSGTTIFDISGQGNHGTLTNGASVIQDGASRALSFDGTDDYVSTSIAGIPRSGSFSFQAWLKMPNVNPPTNRVIATQGLTDGWKVLLWPNGSSIRINCFGRQNLDFSWSVLSGLNNTIFQFVLTYDGTTFRLTINGREVNSLAGPMNPSTLTVFELGRSTQAMESGFYIGSMFDCRYWSRQLSPSEILQNYNATRGRFGL
jgi:hypothetical protein